MTTWPKCPECKQPMWMGQVGAPVRIVHGCAHCDIRIGGTVETVEVALFEEA